MNEAIRAITAWRSLAQGCPFIHYTVHYNKRYNRKMNHFPSLPLCICARTDIFTLYSFHKHHVLAMQSDKKSV